MQLSFLRRKILWVVIALGIVFLYPFESTVLPSQNVLVVTEAWRPIQDVKVRQIWQHYSFESEGHEEDLTTDANGRITFPRRTIRASILRRILHPLWNVLTQGVHASFGVHTDMFPAGDLTDKPAGHTKVESRPGDIVFRR
jgi:hypothetical protein